MRIDGLTIALRPRANWEACDLGIALARRHAGVIWGAWWWYTLPFFVLCNAGMAAVDLLWLAWLPMWWLKPLFDRVPMYVLSRAVFGAAPTLRETLRAQWHWQWRAILPWLTWRRLHPGRSMLLAVDLLEQLRGPRRGERCRVLARGTNSTHVMLTFVFLHVDAVFVIGLYVFMLQAVPIEFLSDAAKAIWQTLFESPPWWAQLLYNAFAWLAMSVVEPIYVAAGFGLYLNRRTQLEAWDIELSFRQLAARLTQSALAVLAVVLLAVAAPTARAQDEAPPAHTVIATKQGPDATSQPKPPPDDLDTARGAAARMATKADAPTIAEFFGDAARDDTPSFRADIDKVYAGPDLSGKETIYRWRPRNGDDTAPDRSSPPSAWVEFISMVFSIIAKLGLWLLLGLLIWVIYLTRHLWLPFVSDLHAAVRALDRIETHALTTPEIVPDDPVDDVRALWARGERRAALSLLYRAGVKRVTVSLGTLFPPGCTESECLRRARKLEDPHLAALFPRIVRCWQAAAYAERYPGTDELEDLLARWRPARASGAAP